MKNIPNLLLVLLLAGAMASCQDKPANKGIAKDKNEKKVDPKAAERDAQFAASEILAHHSIIDWAIPEVQDSENRTIRDVAFRLQREHMRLLDQWKEYAEKKNILVRDSSLAGVREAVQKYIQIPGDSLRHKFWIEEMLKQEKNILSRLEDYMDDAGDPELKLILQEELPVIRINRDQLMMLKSKI